LFTLWAAHSSKIGRRSSRTGFCLSLDLLVVSIWVPKLVARSPKLFDELSAIAMSTTKHVKFSEDTAFPPPAAEQPRTNAFAVHPDRLAAVEAASSQAKAVEKKTKTKVSWNILNIRV
jgi:hypothetical protein